MKKLLGIVVLGLLLSSNAYSAYLSCPTKITLNSSEGKYKELYKEGSYIGHYFFKFKGTKKKFTKVTFYSQGNQYLNPTDPDIWMSLPPIKLPAVEFFYTDGRYYLPFDGNQIKMSWFIVKKSDASSDKIWVFEQDIKGLKKFKGIYFFIVSKCEVLDKKEFNELIKKGIK